MAWMWKLYKTCKNCGHRNCPHPSYKKSIRMVLLGQFRECRRCGNELSTKLKETPTVVQIRQELQEQGLLPTTTTEASPASATAPS